VVITSTQTRVFVINDACSNEAQDNAVDCRYLGCGCGNEAHDNAVDCRYLGCGCGNEAQDNAVDCRYLGCGCSNEALWTIGIWVAVGRICHRTAIGRAIHKIFSTLTTTKLTNHLH
jgi:hypothetical protein